MRPLFACFLFFFFSLFYKSWYLPYCMAMAGLRWLKIVSSIFQDLDFLLANYNHSLLLDATIMVSENRPIIGEHAFIIFVTRLP